MIPYLIRRGLDRLARAGVEDPRVQATCERHRQSLPGGENNDAIEANGELRFMRERLLAPR